VSLAGEYPLSVTGFSLESGCGNANNEEKGEEGNF